MAEGTYEYECMRAELLGIHPPDRETFQQLQLIQLKNEIDNENFADELKKIDEEPINDTNVKITELNSILSMTQKKLNKFKRSCGSLTSLLKFRSTPTSSTTGSKENLADTCGDVTALNSNLDTLDAIDGSEIGENLEAIKKTNVELQQTVNNRIDILDNMMMKSEDMMNQNKQSKKTK